MCSDKNKTPVKPSIFELMKKRKTFKEETVESKATGLHEMGLSYFKTARSVITNALHTAKFTATDQSSIPSFDARWFYGMSTKGLSSGTSQSSIPTFGEIQEKAMKTTSSWMGSSSGTDQYYVPSFDERRDNAMKTTSSGTDQYSVPAFDENRDNAMKTTSSWRRS